MAIAPTMIDRAGTSLHWEEPGCLHCGSTRRTTILEAADPHPNNRGLWFAVVECADCGLRYTCPRPDESSIGMFYPTDYRPHRSKAKTKHSHNAPLAWLRGRPCVERRTLPWHGQGRLLDFGCGGGSFLERMAEQGWHVTGVDFSESTVAAVRSRLNVRMVCGSLPHGDLKPGSFDVITMWHSLEHVHRPLEVLQSAHELLAPGGKILVAVPNMASLPFKWFRSSWFALDLPRHLTHFTPKSLSAMMSRAGFLDVKVRSIRHSDWLRSSAKLASARPHASFWQRLLTRKPAARITAWMCYVLGQSDCMLATARV